jgi:hypothetical protein
MLPTLFIPHGGGPLPLLNDPGHTGLISFLKAVPKQIQPKPKAILLVSAHWEVSCCCCLVVLAVLDTLCTPSRILITNHMEVENFHGCLIVVNAGGSCFGPG